jgi:hypothetical protein
LRLVLLQVEQRQDPLTLSSTITLRSTFGKSARAFQAAGVASPRGFAVFLEQRESARSAFRAVDAVHRVASAS